MKHKSYTLQELFDRGWQHLVVEGHLPATDPDGSCVYRGQGELKCMIGISIPDDLYDPGLEGTGAQELGRGALNRTPDDAVARVRSLFSMIDYRVLRKLQAVHDDIAENYFDEIWENNISLFQEQFRDKMTEFANLHNLTIPQ